MRAVSGGGLARALCALVTAGSLATPTLGHCGKNQLVVVSNDEYTPQTSPIAESFTFGKHTLVAVINFDPEKPRKIASIDINLSGYRQTFPITREYYANWSRPVGIVGIDSNGRTVGGSFSMPVASRPGMQSPDFQIFIELVDGKFKMAINSLL